MDLLGLMIYPNLKEELNEYYNANITYEINYMFVIFACYCLISLTKIKLFTYAYDGIVNNSLTKIKRFLIYFVILLITQEIINFFYYN